MRAGWLAVALGVALAGASAAGQSVSPASSSTTARPAAAATAPANLTTGELADALNTVDRVSQQTPLDLARLRIERWKTGGQQKREFQQDSDSLSRNLTTALPGMVQAARANPTAAAPSVKLYRDLNALYDVLASLTTAAGAVGPQEDYRALAADQRDLDSARRSLGDYLEQLAAYQDSELVRLRAAQPTAKVAVPKKIVIDDTEEPRPAKKKKPKTAANPATSKPSPAPQAAQPQ